MYVPRTEGSRLVLYSARKPEPT